MNRVDIVFLSWCLSNDNQKYFYYYQLQSYSNMKKIIKFASSILDYKTFWFHVVKTSRFFKKVSIAMILISCFNDQIISIET